MTKTVSRPTRRLTATGLGVVTAWTLAACADGPPPLDEISESAQQTMNDAQSISFTMSDPDHLLDDELTSMEYSGQFNETNFHLNASMSDTNIEALVVDEDSAFMKFETGDEDLDALFEMSEEQEGKWIEAPESDLIGVEDSTKQFEEISNSVFDLINNLSEEELEAVEVEEDELDGEPVYVYNVPATGEVETELVPSANTASFYFLQDSDTLMRLYASTDDETAVFTFSDYDSVDPVEAPSEDEIADIDWQF